MLRLSSTLGLILTLCAGHGTATAQTTQGTLPADETWSGTVTLVGDLTIPAGRTLTLAAGAQVRFASGDTMGAGKSTSQIELIVEGTLKIAGSAASPVSLAPAAGGTLHSIQIVSGATASISYGDLRGAEQPLDNRGTLTVEHSVFADHRRGALYLAGGTGTVQTSQFVDNCQTYTSTQMLRVSSGTNTVDHNTITNNRCSYAIYLSTNATVRDNIIVDNSTYGIYSTSYRTVQNNLLWRHTTNTYSVSNQNGVVYNPLFVSKTNLRITSLSPARKAASDGSDLGALPYVADVTPTLQGKLVDPMTLGAGTHQITGDFIVATGTTLTLSPGARLQFAQTDGMEGGANSSEAELVVEGTLNATGTAAQGIVFEGASNGTWYGPRVEAGGVAQLAFVELTKMQRSLDNRGTLTLTDSLLQGNDRGAIDLLGGQATVQRTRFVDNCKVSTSTHTVRVTSGSGSFDHNTVAYNRCSYAVYMSTTFTVADNIIADNSTYGIYSTSYRTVQNNLIWRHTTNTYSVSNQNGVVYNPLFVSKSDHRLTSYSPARKAGRGGDDIGALPYISDKTPTLQGKLHEDLVLAAGTHTVVGDLLVGVGATLTLAPGATLQLAETDKMEGGSNSGEAELIVEGTLQAVGSASAKISIEGSAAGGTFYGLRLLSGSSTTLRFAELRDAQRAIDSQGTFELSHSLVDGYDRGAIELRGGSGNVHHTLFTNNCRVSTSTRVIYLSSGTQVFDHNTVADNRCSYAVYLSTNATVQNNIIVDNSTYGIYSTSYRTVQNNLVWQHTTNLYSVSNQNGVSANPLFVAAGDYGLQASSPARNKATDGSDLGAFPFTVGPVDRIEISPSPSVTLAVKGTQAFSAQAYDAANNPIANPSINWSVTSAAGTIDGNGLFTASCAAGSYNGAITAQSGSVSASVSVVLQAGSLASLDVTPTSATVAVKGTQSFSAAGKDSCGNTVPAAAISWSLDASGSAAGSVDPTSGLFTAGCTPGSYPDAVIATAGAIKGTASVTVQAGALATLTISPQNPTMAAGAQQSFAAQGADSCGNALTVSPSWSVIAGGGSIDAAGLFTAGSAAGSYGGTIEARSGSVAATTSVTITAGSIAKVEITPTSATVEVGKSVSFSAKAFDAGGNPVSAVFAWSASNGSIDTNGSFKAGNVAGTFADSVMATADGVTGKASVTITAGPVASVVVTPATITIAPGGQSTFTAKVTDSHGNPRSDTVTWAVSPQAAGSVDTSGNFTAGSAVGVYADAVTASVGSVSGKASVTIAADALHHLELTPKTVTLSPTATTVFSVQGFDAQQNPVTITPTWAVVAGGGTINNQGVFAAGTEAGTFEDTVQVSAEGISAVATVVVEAGQLNQLVLDPTSATLDSGATQQFKVSGVDAWGNAVDVSAASFSADSEAGTIDDKGLFKAGDKSGSWPRGVSVSLGTVEAHAAITVKGETVEPTPSPSDGGCAMAGGSAAGGALPGLVLLLVVCLVARRRR